MKFAHYAKHLPEAGRPIQIKSEIIEREAAKLTALYQQVKQLEQELLAMENNLLIQIEENWTSEEIREARCKAAGHVYTPIN